MKWFRFYHEFIHDTKMKRMPIPHRYAFIVLLCLASASPVRGVITGLDDEDLAFELEMEVEDWQTIKAKFRVKGLIEFTPDGDILIENWDKRQFVSDSSAERVAAHREKKKRQECNVTPPLLKRHVTPSDTDTDSYSDSDSEPENRKESEKEKKEDPISAHARKPTAIADVEVLPPEESPTASSPQKESSARKPRRGRSQKNVPPRDLSIFIEIYNENKPPLFGSVQVMNEKRKASLEALVKDCGGWDEAIAVLTNAMNHVRTDSFWMGRDLSFENCFTNGKILQWHERWLARQEVRGRIGDRGLAVVTSVNAAKDYEMKQRMEKAFERYQA